MSEYLEYLLDVNWIMPGRKIRAVRCDFLKKEQAVEILQIAEKGEKAA